MPKKSKNPLGNLPGKSPILSLPSLGDDSPKKNFMKKETAPPKKGGLLGLDEDSADEKKVVKK